LLFSKVVAGIGRADEAGVDGEQHGQVGRAREQSGERPDDIVVEVSDSLSETLLHGFEG
jgi:hypothetical protein